MIKQWFKSGEPWVWLNAAAVSTNLILVVGLLGLVAVRGLGHFWPAEVVEYHYQDKDNITSTIVGEVVDTVVLSVQQAKDANYEILGGKDSLEQRLIKTGNRDTTGQDFRWIEQQRIKSESYPADMVVIERREWGNFYGRLVAVKEHGKTLATGEQAWTMAQEKLSATLKVFDETDKIQRKDVGAINYALERLRLKQKRWELENQWNDSTKQEYAKEEAAYKADYAKLQDGLAMLNEQIALNSVVIQEASGKEVEIPLAKTVRMFKPNAMGVFAKLGHYGAKVVEFVSEDPREANTEGGIFPAIFGTVMMVMVMAVIVTPLGVIAAVYMREYAKQGFLTRLIRIAVNNLAGVPSIVYGVFGLGFFVYILGGNIDRLFFPESLPAPVFGTPGLLWSSLTLALLTLPVVIVSTEEGLSRIPKAIREGSLALGATKAETLWHTVLPMASPAIMTGLILAVARAAGEVAPLMLVGVVKLAPTLPLDGNFPYMHFDRKFMHLGFHVYDVGFQSPNVEAARPLVYATSLLLVLVIIGLNMSAISIRNHLREKYRALEH
jgi:phosphate transport system permease protein